MSTDNKAGRRPRRAAAPPPPKGRKADKGTRPREEPPRKKADRREIGGPEGPEPTRYGDWERKGRCIDF